MAGSLIDTNVAIPILNGEPQASARFDAANDLYLSLVILGELFFGAYNSARPEVNLKRVESFAARIVVLALDLSTARTYGLTKAAQVRKGRPIPENDLWIAATALQHDLTLVTRDAHFDEVDGLRTERW